MSFTVQLFAVEDKLLPLANEDELFILERAKISFQTKSSDHTFKGKGRVYCTTQRIIFVAEKGSMQHGLFFEAFEIPLVDMTDEKFNQPIFGACSISGVVKPNQKRAFVDPNDPTVIYIVQPVKPSGSATCST
ncbi:hypothetical protein FI667_g11175, partial [Globisporangium splendens]